MYVVVKAQRLIFWQDLHFSWLNIFSAMLSTLQNGENHNRSGCDPPLLQNCFDHPEDCSPFQKNNFITTLNSPTIFPWTLNQDKKFMKLPKREKLVNIFFLVSPCFNTSFCMKLYINLSWLNSCANLPDCFKFVASPWSPPLNYQLSLSLLYTWHRTKIFG